MQFLHKCFYKGYKPPGFGAHAKHRTAAWGEASREASHPYGARGCKLGAAGRGWGLGHDSCPAPELLVQGNSPKA